MDTKLLEKKMESISPFELKNRLIDMADESLKKTARTMLNAGRGNPNWIATAPREAFFLLGSFGLEECRRIMDLPEGIAGIPEKKGIASRFEAFLKKNNNVPGAKLLEQTYNYLLMRRPRQPCTRMGRKHCRRPVSRARPHPSFYGNPCARLPFARDVRQPSSPGCL